MAERASGDTALYRTESPWGERLGRVLFWKDAGAVSERRAAHTVKEAQIMTERWIIHHNTVRLHSSLGGQSPVHETIQLAS